MVLDVLDSIRASQSLSVSLADKSRLQVVPNIDNDKDEDKDAAEAAKTSRQQAGESDFERILRDLSVWFTITRMGV